MNSYREHFTKKKANALKAIEALREKKDVPAGVIDLATASINAIKGENTLVTVTVQGGPISGGPNQIIAHNVEVHGISEDVEEEDKAE